jgi:hypothetical protein
MAILTLQNGFIGAIFWLIVSINYPGFSLPYAQRWTAPILMWFAAHSNTFPAPQASAVLRSRRHNNGADIDGVCGPSTPTDSKFTSSAACV